MKYDQEPYDQQVKRVIRSTGLVTNEQAWTCSDAVMKLPVWDRAIVLEEALTKLVRAANNLNIPEGECPGYELFKRSVWEAEVVLEPLDFLHKTPSQSI